MTKPTIHKINQETYARLFKELLDVPMTSQDAVEATGLHLCTAQSLMRCLRKHKVVHISAWETDSKGRDVTPVYALGGGRDKPRRKLTAAQRQARCRAKKKSLEQTNVINVPVYRPAFSL